MLETLKKSVKALIKVINKSKVSKKSLNKYFAYFNQEDSIKFVFPSPSVPWGYLFQRPQQLALALSRLGHKVIYSVEGEYRIIPDRKVIGLRNMNNNLYLYNDYAAGKHLKSLNKVVIWRYWANQYNYLREDNMNNVTIYDWVDDIGVYHYNELENYFHNKMVMESDIVITTAEDIYIKAQEIRKDVLLLPNACDYEHFSNPIPIEWKELDNICNNYDVIIGYYGAIADWFDFEIIKHCSEANPSWLFLIVGQAYPDILVKNNIDKYKNIVIWDRVEYNKLPYLLSKFHIAMIPFKVNEITQATSPVKIYEYMAGGKPIVSTNMKEVSKLGTALIACDKYEFNEKLHKALTLANDVTHISFLKETAQNHSWVERARVVLEELEKRGLV